MTQQYERIIGVRPYFDARRTADLELEKALDEKREEARRWMNTTGGGSHIPPLDTRASVDKGVRPLSVVSGRE